MRTLARRVLPVLVPTTLVAGLASWSSAKDGTLEKDAEIIGWFAFGTVCVATVTLAVKWAVGRNS